MTEATWEKVVTVGSVVFSILVLAVLMWMVLVWIGAWA